MLTWALEVEKRRGKKVAAVALARKLAAILFALGMIDKLRELASAKSDEIGLSLEEERLPKRIDLRPRRVKKAQPESEKTRP